MSTRELKDLLEDVHDTREIVLAAAPSPGEDATAPGELSAVWSSARAEANRAYRRWCERPGAEPYAAYRAAADRADAAADALAGSTDG